MPTSYPGALDSLSNPTANDTLAAVPHHTQHSDANDAIEALEAKVGIGSSTSAVGKALIGTAAGASAWRTTNVFIPAVTADGATDDATTIQASITAAAAAGGGDVLVVGSCAIATGLTISSSNIRLVGPGSDGVHDVGSLAPAAALIWTGSAGGTMLTVAPVEGASNKRLYGCDAIGVALRGQGVAGKGLVVKSVFRGKFDLYAEHFTDTAFEVGCVATLGEATDTQLCEFRYQADQNATGDGSILKADADSGASGNPSFNTWWITGQYRDATAIELLGTDNNEFMRIRTSRHASGSAVGLILGARATGAYCRANRFYSLSPGAGGVTAQGTETATNPSSKNIIYSYDKENGLPDPTVGTGAQLTWYRDDRPLGVRGPSNQQVTEWFCTVTSDVTTTSTSLGDVTGLTVTVKNTTTYAFEFAGVYRVTPNTTTGIKLAINAPAGSTMRAFKEIQTTNTPNGTDNLQGEWLNTLDTATATADVDTAATGRFWRIRGFLISAGAGALAVRVASEVEGAEVVVARGSWGRVSAVGQHA